jgi:hypothetical protein
MTPIGAGLRAQVFDFPSFGRIQQGHTRVPFHSLSSALNPEPSALSYERSFARLMPGRRQNVSLLFCCLFSSKFSGRSQAS